MLFLFFLVKVASQRIKKPVTCKIRVYESIEKTVEYAKRLEKAGAKVKLTLTVFATINFDRVIIAVLFKTSKILSTHFFFYKQLGC